MVFIRWIRKKRFPEAKLTKPIILFICAAATSLLLGAKAVEAKQVIIGGLYLVRWVAITSIYFYLVDFQKREISLFGRRLTLREALLFSGLSLTVLGLLQYAIFPNLTQFKWLGWDDHSYRLTGTLLDPGFTGIIMVLTTLLAMGIRERWSVKLTAVGLPVIALLLTYSRASYLAFLIGLLVFSGLRHFLKPTIVAGAIFLTILFFLPRVAGESTNLLRQYSIFSRVETWKHALIIIKDNPVTGVGFNLLRYTQNRYGFLGEDWKTSHSASGVDNSYLFVLATTGLLGGSAFTWLIYSMWKLFFKLREKDQAGGTSGIASLIALSVHSIFNNSWFYPWVMIWLWILLTDAETTPRKIPFA